MAKITLVKPGTPGSHAFINNVKAEEIASRLQKLIAGPDSSDIVFNNDEKTIFTIFPVKVLREHVIIVEEVPDANS